MQVQLRARAVKAVPKARHCKRKAYIRASFGSFTLPETMVTSNIATISKVASYFFTYPLETIKLYSQMGRVVRNPMVLYQGFGVFVLTAMIQCYINYNIFFAAIQTLSVQYQHPKHLAILYASFVSCFITSFMRVPMAFLSRNIVFLEQNHGGCGLASVPQTQSIFTIMQHFTMDMYKKGWLINMLIDVPDSFIKFFMNAYLGSAFPGVGVLARSCLTGIVTCIINTPLDYMVTKTLCYETENEKKLKLAKGLNAPKFEAKGSKPTDCMSGLEYRILSSILGNCVFFYIFNTLRPSL